MSDFLEACIHNIIITLLYRPSHYAVISSETKTEVIYRQLKVVVVAAVAARINATSLVGS